jgi:hypothetical protein
MLSGSFGRCILPAGAVGEFLPIVGIAIFLSANGKFLGLISLVSMALVALFLAWLPRITHGKRIAQIAREGEHATAQITLRITLCLMFLLLVVASDFGLDVVLGAFLAGAVLKRWAPGDVHSLETKLDAVGYGFFIPVFFIYSGMTLDLQAIAEAGRLPVPAADRARRPGAVPLSARPGGFAAAADDVAHRYRPTAARRPVPDRVEHRTHAPGERRGAGGRRRVVGRVLPGPHRGPQEAGQPCPSGLGRAGGP